MHELVNSMQLSKVPSKFYLKPSGKAYFNNSNLDSNKVISRPISSISRVSKATTNKIYIDASGSSVNNQQISSRYNNIKGIYGQKSKQLPTNEFNWETEKINRLFKNNTQTISFQMQQALKRLNFKQ